MKLIAKFIFQFLSNTLALYVAAQFISGFVFTGGLNDLFLAAAVLALINLFLKPVLKLIFGPLIVLTFGLFIIVVNALALYILDFFISPLTIQGYLPLLYSSLFIGFINFIFSVSGRTVYKD
jgi:putative membrane protein